MTRQSKTRLRRWTTRLLAIVVLLLAGLAGWTALTWHSVAALATENPETTSFIDAARARGDRIQWRWVPYDRISPAVKKAVVSAEDMSFFSHSGFDTHELRIALREAVQRTRVRGASTITQQVAKNLWLSPSRSPLRKLREGVLTWQLERSLTKQRILELYLNIAQFGPETYGVEAAARQYYGVSAVNLDADQAAALAAALPRPTSWHPGVQTRGYQRAVDRIRRRVAQGDWLDVLL